MYVFLHLCQLQLEFTCMHQASLLQGALQDISAYKDVQRRLDESLASWRRLAEAMPMIVWTAAHDGQLTYASPAMGEYSGEDEASAHGDGWAGLIHPEDKPAAIAAWSASVSTGSPAT